MTSEDTGTPRPANQPPDRRRSRWTLILAVVLGVLLVGGGARSLGLFDTRPGPLRVAINPWPGYEFASLAQSLGYFEEEGVEVRLLELSSLGDARRAFERGQADAFFGTVTELLHSREQSDREAQVALVTDYSNGADMVLARPPLKSVAELKGMTVGIETGSLNEFILARALETAGLSWNDVRTVHLAALNMPAAIANKTVDAVVTYPPMSIEILASRNADVIFTTRTIPGEVVDVLAVAESVARGRNREVSAFIRAFHRAQEFTQAHPEEAYRIMAARERLSPSDFAGALTNGITIVDRAGQSRFLGENGSLPGIIATTERVLRQIGQLKGTTDSAHAVAESEGE